MADEHVRAMLDAGKVQRAVGNSRTFQSRLHREQQRALAEQRRAERERRALDEDGRDWGPKGSRRSK